MKYKTKQKNTTLSKHSKIQ